MSFASTGGYFRAMSFLRSQHYDAALDLQGLIKSATWARASGAKRVIGFDRDDLREPLAASLYSETVKPDVSGHVIRKNLSILPALGVTPGPPELLLQPLASAEMIKAIQLAGGSNGYIVINPGAAWPNKRWPPDRFGAVAKMLRDRTGLHSLVTWGPQERDLAESVYPCVGRRSLARATDVGLGSGGADAIRGPGHLGRHGPAAHCRGGRHAHRRTVWTDAARAKRSVGTTR